MLDLTALLRGESGDSLFVAGVCVGEAAVRVERAALTGADEEAPGGVRVWANGKVYRAGADGELAEVSLCERIEATLQGGGVLRVGDIALSIKGGLVTRVFVRGPSLASFGWTSEADVERALGPPAGSEWQMGSRLRYYPERNLVVAWSAREDRLEHVALGPTRWVEPRLGAAELLAEVLAAFPVLGPIHWAEPEQGAAQVRHCRIAALARALGVGSPRELVDGSFLKEPLSPGRQAVVEELASVRRHGGGRRSSNAEMLFCHLLGYRWRVERVIAATSGWLECSDPALLGMIAAQDRIGARVRELMVDVDRWLRTLIDPSGRTIELRELIARYGWPDVDLRELELDEM